MKTPLAPLEAMALAQFQANRRLWLFISVGLFVGLGFVNPVAGASWSLNMSYWSFVEQLVSGNLEAIAPVVLFGLALGIFCLLVGWLMQAIAVILLLPKFRSAAALRRSSVSRSDSPR